MLLHYELARAGEAAKANAELQQAVEVLRQAVGGSSDLVDRVKPALRYVLRCARGQDADDADLALLDRRQRAAIWGLRASALRLYGSLGWQAAQDCAENAVALDLDEPAWQLSLGLHRRDRALLGPAVGAAPRAGSRLYLVACMLWEAARARRGPDALDDLDKAQGALLLRLAAALSRRRGPLRQAKLAQLAARQGEACARRLLALAGQCLLAHVVVAAVWGAKGRGALRLEQREDVHRLYGAEAHRVVE
ncbi:hypothetical protein FOCC_FOCC013267, partial [Frankliniella occidentalis]